MKVLRGYKNIGPQSRRTAVTVGMFDGVHIGHGRIIRVLIRQAKILKSKAVVVTFEPHPSKVLKGEDCVAMISSLRHRLGLFQRMGVDICVVIKFDSAIAGLDSRRFIRDILINKLNMATLVVGKSFSFGSDRLRDKRSLIMLSKRVGFKTVFVQPKIYHKRVISSSYIRHLIEKGSLDIAERLLGRPVSILGTVISGRRRGRVIGFNTANIDPHHEAIPPGGVYAVYSRLDGRVYKSVLNIGTRPTFKEKEPSIEVHIFGIDRDIYGKDIEVLFKKRLRPERRFKDESHLSAQISKDINLARKTL